MRDYLVVSCEHGGNEIPAPYRRLFQADECRALLDSHRGYDAGALIMARELAAHFAAPLVTSTVSRLLVDLNRSLGNPRVFSPMVRAASALIREQIVAEHYRPYRSLLEDCVRQATDSGHRVVHISCHSFTPELYGQVRNADIGLLYDPRRAGEQDFSRRWQAVLQEAAPVIKIRRNYPYCGRDDGLTRQLRHRFGADCYLGIELEINQKHVAHDPSDWQPLRAKLIASLDQSAASSRV